MKFYMEVVHDIKYLQLKFGPNWSIFRGVTISFFLSYTKKILFFSKFRYQENFGHKIFFLLVFIRVYYRCMNSFRAMFQLFLGLQAEKRPKISKICDFGSDGCQKIVI